jgi:hypothetical protein
MPNYMGCLMEVFIKLYYTNMCFKILLVFDLRQKWTKPKQAHPSSWTKAQVKDVQGVN